jgi:hypothetical protein
MTALYIWVNVGRSDAREIPLVLKTGKIKPFDVLIPPIGDETREAALFRRRQGLAEMDLSIRQAPATA